MPTERDSSQIGCNPVMALELKGRHGETRDQPNLLAPSRGLISKYTRLDKAITSTTPDPDFLNCRSDNRR